MVTRTKKIFVGGLSVSTTVEDVKQYFEQFGKVGLHRGALWELGKHQRLDQAGLRVAVRSSQVLQQAKEGLALRQVRPDQVIVWVPYPSMGRRLWTSPGEGAAR